MEGAGAVAGLVGPAEAVAVAMPGLLLGVWLAVGSTSHVAHRRTSVRGAAPAGWVLVMSSVALMVLALPMTSGTTPVTPVPHMGPGVARTASTPARTSARSPVLGGPG